MFSNKIGLIGLGTVGETLRKWIIENTSVKMALFDPALEMNDDVGECDIVFISVPVNNKSMMQDLSIIKESIKRCSETATIIIRSSVLPGTCDDLSKEFNQTICYMPEFLTERRAQYDFNQQDIIVGVPEGTLLKHKKDLKEKLDLIFKDFKEISFHSNMECEMAKYTHNCFGAMKVTYFNIINSLCEKKNINFDMVREIAFGTGFINREHTMVPGPDGKKGFGGTCFPVNIEAMIGYTKNDASVAFFKDIYCLNRFYRGEKKL